MIIELAAEQSRFNGLMVVDHCDRRIEGPKTVYNCIEKTQYRINGRSIWVENNTENNLEITSGKWRSCEVRTVYKGQV